MSQYACVHGHFYQPPRENPWTGVVERQTSAGRDHDWNARVARECYLPNGEARVVDGDGCIIDIVDNYAWLSHDFGPTLLAWLEKAHPDAYARLIRADAASAARLNGHGNAIAQSFHHSILPLATPRDRRTEIRWGLADFEKRYGRKSKGLWLPECAVDDATLADVADEGVMFVILELGSAEAVRVSSSKPWLPANHIETGTPYLWTDGARRLTVFFYEGPLSRSVAFEHAMRDSAAFAEVIAKQAVSEKSPRAVFVATDGESYGHHEQFAEMGLAHLLRYALPRKGLTLVNPSWLAAQKPPTHEVRLRAGGTSWSCPHGVERWRSACGCGTVESRQQTWRGPLRAALEHLRTRFEELFVAQSNGLIADPWAARDAYIAVVLDRSEEQVSAFLDRFAPAARTPELACRVLKLLEIQRHALMMFTSCGWFFDEISRLEPVQILLYAARALELARELGFDFEPDFVAMLALAPSNDSRLRDGAGVWRELVLPQIVSRDHVAAHFAVELIFSQDAPRMIHRYRVRNERLTRHSGSRDIVAGRAVFYDDETLESWTRTYFASVLSGRRVQAYVCDHDIPDQDWDGFVDQVANEIHIEGMPPGRLFRLRDLRPDEREKALTAALAQPLARWEQLGKERLDDIFSLVGQFRGLGLTLPSGLAEEAGVSVAHAVAEAARRFAEGNPVAVEEIRTIALHARSIGISFMVPARAEELFSRGIHKVLASLENGGHAVALNALELATDAADAAGLLEWRMSAQVRLFRWLKSNGLRPIQDQAAGIMSKLGLKP